MLLQRAWELAKSPFKNIFMTLFMAYMTGSGVQIFSIMFTGYMLYGPIATLLATNKGFVATIRQLIVNCNWISKHVWFFFFFRKMLILRITHGELQQCLSRTSTLVNRCWCQSCFTLRWISWRWPSVFGKLMEWAYYRRPNPIGPSIYQQKW